MSKELKLSQLELNDIYYALGKLSRAEGEVYRRDEIKALADYIQMHIFDIETESIINNL
jgi:Mg-chelatase subunit ChlI